MYLVDVLTKANCVNFGLWHEVFIGLLLSASVLPNFAQLKNLANRIRSRMQSLGLNETQLAERCSVAAIHLFEDHEAPHLTRDRIAKILMHRQEVPAKSAARVISDRELRVLANVLNVSTEWLIGQEQNRDPVVWNVLAQPDRVQIFAQLLKDYEEFSEESTIWSRYPLYSYVADEFVHAFNQVYYGEIVARGNGRQLVDFYDHLARARRKTILKPDRPFELINVMFKSDFELIVSGGGVYSSISRSILTRNLQVIIDTITNASLKMKLILVENEDPNLTERLRGFDLLGTVDEAFSVWAYHNGDIGWSEHSVYVKSHETLLRSLTSKPHLDLNETVEFIDSIKKKVRSRT